MPLSFAQTLSVVVLFVALACGAESGPAGQRGVDSGEAGGGSAGATGGSMSAVGASSGASEAGRGGSSGASGESAGNAGTAGGAGKGASGGQTGPGSGLDCASKEGSPQCAQGLLATHPCSSGPRQSACVCFEPCQSAADCGGVSCVDVALTSGETGSVCPPPYYTCGVP